MGAGRRIEMKPALIVAIGGDLSQTPPTTAPHPAFSSSSDESSPGARYSDSITSISIQSDLLAIIPTDGRTGRRMRSSNWATRVQEPCAVKAVVRNYANLHGVGYGTVFEGHSNDGGSAATWPARHLLCRAADHQGAAEDDRQGDQP